MAPRRSAARRTRAHAAAHLPACALLVPVAAATLAAQQPTRPDSARADSTRRTQPLAGVRIVADTRRALDSLPGAATLVTPAEVRRTMALGVHELVRRAPGVHAVDEEGLGFRTNIGIRGTDPARSFNVVLLEDGVPVVHAPYLEPQTYYSPPAERMTGVEIVKGADALRYGPQTTGGVINYLTSEPPTKRSLRARLLGSGQIQTAFVEAGGPLAGADATASRAGAARVSYLRRQVDDLRGVWARVDDVGAKWAATLGTAQRLGAKLGYYRERTNSTYLGLTEAMYQAGRFTAPAPDDFMDVERPSASLLHEWQPAAAWRLRTTAFAYRTRRDNRRQDFARNTANNNRPTNFTGTILGDTTVRGGAIFLQRTSGGRNRTITTTGLESRLDGSFTALGARHAVEVGGRLMDEGIDSRFILGRSPFATDSLTRDREQRDGTGAAAWVQDRIAIGDRLALTPGVRVEHAALRREIQRASYPRIGIRDTSIVGTRRETIVLPGLGATWALRGRADAPGAPASLYANVHRGFAPFRFTEAIDNSGLVTALEPERSWNSELGIRTPLGRGVSAELTGFLLLFENQTVSASDTWGRTDEIATGFANGGRTRNAGFESALRVDLGALGAGVPLSLGARYTFTDARFTSDRFYQDGASVVNVNGRRLPYAPRHTAFVDAVLATARTETQLLVTAIGRQFGDRRNLAAGSADGQTGAIPGYALVDVTTSVALPRALARGSGASVLLAVRNALDSDAIVTRRPQGIRVAPPRQVMLGVRLGD